MKDLKYIFNNKKYINLFLYMGLASFGIFLAVTLLFPWSSFLFFNYFLKNPSAMIPGLFTAVLFSLAFGITSSFVGYQFRGIFTGKVYRNFIIISLAILTISYILTLTNTSYSILSYAEMNGFFFTLLSFSLIGIFSPLSGLMISSFILTLKNYSKGDKAGGIGGILIGGVSMGCPACGALVLSLLGVGAGLAIFPFKGLELKILAVGILIFLAYRMKKTVNCSVCLTETRKKEKFFSNKHEKNIMIAISLVALFILFNQFQIAGISSSFDSLTGTVKTGSSFFGSVDLKVSDAEISKISTTQMALSVVFPELQKAKSEEDVISIMLPTGTPEYSEALGGITFDDPEASLGYLAKWYYSLKEEVQENDPQTWQRYLNLAAAPRGISCEFCCGVGPQGITSDGNLRCGCQHNPAVQAVTMGLMRDTDYSDAEILREVMKWKTSFYPKNMISLGSEVIGQDPSQLKSQNLPGMVGGC